MQDIPLAALGTPHDAAATYLRGQPTPQRFGDVWVRWGDSTADKAEAVLHVRGTPTTLENIFAAIGPGYTSLRVVSEALYEDHRFIRATRQTLGLRTWGIDEYGGVSTRSAPASTRQAERSTSTSWYTT